MTDPDSIQGWIVVFTSGTDYEADIVRDRLDDAGIPAVVYAQRDHAFNLNVGNLARTSVYVKPEDETAARTLLDSAPISGTELEKAAMEADPISPDAHTPDNEALLDSGIERISFDVPDEGGEPLPPAA